MFQSRVQIGAPLRLYLVRVFVDINRQPMEVVTVYRTSRIEVLDASARVSEARKIEFQTTG